MVATIKSRWTSLGLLGGLLLAAAIGMALAGAFSALPRLPAWYDAVVHALAWFAVALLVAVVLDARGVTRTRQHAVAFVVLVTLSALGIGVLWDLAAWLLSAGTRLGGVLAGTTDSATDLLVDLSAALFGATVAAAVLVPPRPRATRAPGEDFEHRAPA